MYTGLYHPGMYTGLYHPGSMVLYTTRGSMVLYTTLGTPSYPPWYTPYPTMVYTAQTLPDDEALGSTMRNSLGMRRRELSFSQRCVGRAESLRRVTPLFLV